MVFSAFSTSDAVRCMFDNKFSGFIHVGETEGFALSSGILNTD